MLSITIDWLSFNFKEWTNEAENFMRDYARFSPTQNTAPRFGYSDATMDGNGVVIMWNSDRADMGHHVIFSGSALRNLFMHSEIQQQSLLHAVLDASGSVSRLDLACDLQGQTIDLSRLYKSLEQGLNSGTARTFGQIKSAGGGETIYVGSRQSERFIRIYNKAAQQGMVNLEWFRFELETKGMVARALASELVKGANWQAVFVGVCSGMVSIPGSAELEPFYTDVSVQIGLPKIEKQTDRELWIDTQVISAVIKHAVEHPDSAAVERLFKALKFVLRDGTIW